MYVYLGKLDWKPYGDDETFTVILPNGPVRVGDPVYLFFQWTKDAKGFVKPNWFQNLLVDKVTKSENGDDVFVVNHYYYKYEITAQQGYNKLSLVMSNPSNAKSTMSFERLWKPEGEQTITTGRIWTGKINWLRFADNEASIIIVPEGFGEGKPVITIWQWTESSSGKKKDPQPRIGTQTMHPQVGGVKFSFQSYYTITGVWNEATEKLAVSIDESGHKQDQPEFTLAAVVERHQHNWNPPEPTPGKEELEVRLPQAQPSLTRLLKPLPFPRTLNETLEHAAAFIDQAGYLAKYAEGRFNLLDQDFHLQGQQLTTTKSENKTLKDKIAELNDELIAEKGKAAGLAQSLQKAREEAAADSEALNKKIKDLQDSINDDAISDAKILQLLQQTQAELETQRAANADLQQRLDAALLKLKDVEAQLDTAKAKIASQDDLIKDLENKLTFEKKQNGELQEKNTELEGQNGTLKTDLDKTTGDLQTAREERDKAQKDNGDKDLLIRELQERIKVLEATVDEKTKAYEALDKKWKAKFAKIMQDLQSDD